MTPPQLRRKIFSTIILAHWCPGLQGRQVQLATQAHAAPESKAIAEFQKHESQVLSSVRARIAGRSDSLSQSILQPSRHRQPAGPDIPKLSPTSFHTLNSQATSWTVSPGAQKDALALVSLPLTREQPQALRGEVTPPCPPPHVYPPLLYCQSLSNTHISAFF